MHLGNRGVQEVSSGASSNPTPSAVDPELGMQRAWTDDTIFLHADRQLLLPADPPRAAPPKVAALPCCACPDPSTTCNDASTTTCNDDTQPAGLLGSPLSVDTF